MQIQLRTTTVPETISREDAAKLSNRSISSIDKAKDFDLIDWGKQGRHILIVYNKKWKDYVSMCKARDWCDKHGLHHLKLTSLKQIIVAVETSDLFNNIMVEKFHKSYK